LSGQQLNDAIEDSIKLWRNHLSINQGFKPVSKNCNNCRCDVGCQNRKVTNTIKQWVWLVGRELQG
jgi:hypothetical protein